MARKGKFDDAWEKLLKSEIIIQNLNDKGYYKISADDIRDLGVEPRLMTKIDKKAALPKVLEKYNCAPLAISSKEYLLIRPADLLFYKINNIPNVPKKFIALQDLQLTLATISWDETITSESRALDLAFLSSIFNDFFNEEKLYLTIRGKYFLPEKIPLKFNINNSTWDTTVDLNKVQMEIDSGFEGENNVYLIEAKIGIPEDFNIRQLYFPYKYWDKYLTNKNCRKKIEPILFLYSNHSIYLYRFQFTNPSEFNSLELVDAAWYEIGERNITKKIIADILKNNVIQIIPNIPFPQADIFPRIIDIIGKVNDQELVSSDLAELYDFTSRQGDYYANAAQWLGWIQRFKNKWVVTKQGKNIFESSPNNKLFFIISSLASRPVVNEALNFLFEKDYIPPRTMIEEWIDNASKQGIISQVSHSTIKRRAQTIESWMNYINIFIT